MLVIAIGKYAGEGLDLPRLDTLFFTMPIVWKDTLAQYVGRLHRSAPGKTEVRIYDYVDLRMPMPERMYHKRLPGYASLGYTICADAPGPQAPEGAKIFTGPEFLTAFYADIAAAQLLDILRG